MFDVSSPLDPLAPQRQSLSPHGFSRPDIVLKHSAHQIKYLPWNEVPAHTSFSSKKKRGGAPETYDNYQIEDCHKVRNNETSGSKRS